MSSKDKKLIARKQKRQVARTGIVQENSRIRLVELYKFWNLECRVLARLKLSSNLQHSNNAFSTEDVAFPS